MDNIVSAKLDSRYASTLGVWQYDYGQVLRITGPELPLAVEVQFSLDEKSGETLSRVGTTVGIELAGGTVVGQKMGLDKFSGIVGAVASIINITQTLAQTPKCLSPKETDYAYLFYAKEEL